jgi:hypothetical protein
MASELRLRDIGCHLVAAGVQTTRSENAPQLRRPWDPMARSRRAGGPQARNGQDGAHEPPGDDRPCAAVHAVEGDEVSERVGHSVHWGPVTTHHARERTVFRPFLSVRTWIMISAGLLVASIVLGLTVGSGGGGPAVIGCIVAGYVAWRAAYKWRAWNEAVAAQKTKEAQAAVDESDRKLHRQWLRQQVHGDGA